MPTYYSAKFFKKLHEKKENWAEIVNLNHLKKLRMLNKMTNFLGLLG